MIKRQTLKKSNEMMMVMEATEIIQKLEMIPPQIHLSNLPGNTWGKNQTKSSELLMLKMMMIEVTAVVSLNHQ